MTSGDPRKQPRPDGRNVAEQITQTFPPSLSGVVTEFGTSVIPFPFLGQKGIQIEVACGPLKVHLVLDPEFAEAVAESVMQAKTEAQSKLVPATMADIPGAA